MRAHQVGDVSGIERDGFWMFRGIPFAGAAGRAAAVQAAPAGRAVGRRAGRHPVQRHGAAGASAASESDARRRQVRPVRGLPVPQRGDASRRRRPPPGAGLDPRGRLPTGSGSVPWYHGTRLAERDDVVVVSINYRLGVLGFSHLGPGLGEGYAGSGNAGILDQIAALEWVRDNIDGFGGDPGNVTIFGESAGGMSVGTLLGTPAAAGLFRRAIAESGACQALSSTDQAATVTEMVAKEVGGFEALLTATLEVLLAAQNAVSTPLTGSFGSGSGATGLLPSSPVVDGVVAPDPAPRRRGRRFGRRRRPHRRHHRPRVHAVPHRHAARLDRRGPAPAPGRAPGRRRGPRRSSTATAGAARTRAPPS